MKGDDDEEQRIDHIPYYLSGLSRAHFLPTTFLEIAIYTCIMMQNRLLYALMTQYKSLYDLKILEKLFLE